MQVQIELDVQDLHKKFEILRKETDPLKVLDEAGAVLLNRVRKRFLNEVDPDGNPWKPSRAGIRRRSKGGTGTLFDTGRLYRSIQLAPTQTKPLAQGEMAESTIFTDVEYGAAHQYGTKRLPKRRFLGINQDDMEIYGKVLARRLNQELNK